MKPLIGIIARVEYPGNTKHYVFKDAYREKLIEYGADVIGIIPPQTVDLTSARYNEQPDLSTDDINMIKRQIDLCDGIILPGGFKTNKFDRYIIDYLIETDKPTLGICLGMQQLSNYKREMFLNKKNESNVDHKIEGQTCYHDVEIVKDTKIYNIIKKDKINVNSRHLYHIVPNEYFVNTSYAPDGYIESIEMKDKKYIIGVQWHPEDLSDDATDNLFNSFIEACKK
jgi:gamma-glutamyl-gamma-aminobutyrate hydrolase PuuD